MNKFLATTVGMLCGIGFLWAAVAIFVWDVEKLQQARDSRDWPRAEGTITRSGVDDSRRERRPDIVYTYTVAGVPYTSSQISFDLFDKPGGQGRIESIIARYPVGQKVTVYYDQKEPATAILEPEDYSPFFVPLLFGALFFSFGTLTLWILWRSFRQFRQEGQPPQPDITPQRHIAATAAMSVLVYVILVLVSFDSAVRDTFVKAFGNCPCGIPNIIFMLALQTVLYLPMPWVFWHGMQLTSQALEDGSHIDIGYLLTVGRFHPELRPSQLVCIGGLVYFLVIGGAWIVYAAACGI